MIDFAEVNSASLTVGDIRNIADYCRNYREQFGHAKCAIYVVRDSDYGLVRMWQVFVSTNVWDVSENLFRSRDAAKDWLSV